MQWRNSADRWGATARLLHWGTALLIIGLVAVGLLMQELPNSLFKLKVYAWHKSFGLTVLALVLVRLGWRLFDPRPPYPAGMPAWQQRLSSIAHGLMYLLIIAMPLSGWLYNSAANFPLRWFGLFGLPSLAAPDPELKQLARLLHAWGFYLLGLLFTLHVGAALHHHFVKRDTTLARMLPGLRRPQEPPR
jgi:cytochrome b561